MKRIILLIMLSLLIIAMPFKQRYNKVELVNYNTTGKLVTSDSYDYSTVLLNNTENNYNYYVVEIGEDYESKQEVVISYSENIQGEDIEREITNNGEAINEVNFMFDNNNNDKIHLVSYGAYQNSKLYIYRVWGVNY